MPAPSARPFPPAAVCRQGGGREVRPLTRPGAAAPPGCGGRQHGRRPAAAAPQRRKAGQGDGQRQQAEPVGEKPQRILQGAGRRPGQQPQQPLFGGAQGQRLTRPPEGRGRKVKDQPVLPIHRGRPGAAPAAAAPLSAQYATPGPAGTPPGPAGTNFSPGHLVYFPALRYTNTVYLDVCPSVRGGAGIPGRRRRRRPFTHHNTRRGQPWKNSPTPMTRPPRR